MAITLFKVISDPALVPSTLSNFPLPLIGGNFPASFWSVVKSGGGDIRVYLDVAKTIQIPHDVVYIDVGSNIIDLRYRVTSLDDTVGTEVYIEAGDAAKNMLPVTDTYGRNATWSEAQSSVLMEDATPVDHTGNHTFGITGTLTNIAGPIGRANSFVTTDRLSNADAALRDILTTYDTTVSVISRGAAYAANQAVLSWSGADDFVLYPLDNTAGNSARTFWRDIGGIDGTVEALANTWIWNDFTTRASNDHELYTNGLSVGTASGTGTAGPFTTFFIGGFGSQNWDNDIAQVIVWKTARSDDWVEVQKTSQSDPVTFWGVATEVVSGFQPAWAINANGIIQ